MQFCVKLVKYGANVRLIKSPALFGDEIYGPQPYSGTKFMSLSWIGLVFYGLFVFFAWSLTRCSRIRCVFYALYVDSLRISWAFYGFASYFMGLTWICCVLCDLGPFWNLKPDPHPREAPKHPKMSFLGPFCWMVLATLRNSVGQRKLRDFSKNSDIVCVKFVKHSANLRKACKTRCKSSKFV